jgi:hypothetical protein
MKIEHIFTDAAKKMLVEEQKKLSDDLREEAVNEAFRSRGKPVEVTASDVSKAAAKFRHEEIKLKVRYPSTVRLLQAYIWGGLILLAFAVVAYFVGLYIEVSPIIERITAMSGMLGAIMIFLGFVMRFYLSVRLRQRQEKERTVRSNV